MLLLLPMLTSTALDLALVEVLFLLNTTTHYKIVHYMYIRLTATLAPEGETQEARNKREALQTAREIKAAVAAAEGRYCWVVYHDGGYTAELDATEKQPARPAKAGLGY